MGEDGIEEVRERGNQARDDAAHKEGVEGAIRSPGSVEPARSSVFPLSFSSPAVSRRVAARFFSETLGASRAGSYQAGGEEALTFWGAIGR